MGVTHFLGSDSFIGGVLTMLNFALRVVPLATAVARKPKAAIDVLVLRITEVDLVAEVALVVLLEALMAVATEID